MKTTNVCTTKPNKTKAWFRSTFTPSGKETEQVDPTAHRSGTDSQRL